jgi:hypothetical protein
VIGPFLNAFEFRGAGAVQGLLDAVRLVADIYRTGRRRLPDKPPLRGGRPEPEIADRLRLPRRDGMVRRLVSGGDAIEGACPRPIFFPLQTILKSI